MALSISQALKLNSFSKAHLLTGEVGLEHEINSVNIIEAPMEEKWETKKALFLTSFYAIKDDLNEQIRTIELLAAGESAGLVFQTGILDELPEAVIQRARELGLPIIEIPEEVDYSEVIQPVVSAILQEKTYLLQRSDEIHRQLSTLSLAGGGLKSVVTALSGLINHPVTVLDSWGSVLASAGFEEGCQFEELLPKYHSRQSERQAEEYWRERGYRLVSLLPSETQPSSGYILAYDPISTLDALDRVAMEQAAVMASLELVKQRAVLEAERRLQRGFFENLLGKEGLSENEILTHAHSFGWDLRGKHVAALMDISRAEQSFLSRVGSSRADLELAKIRFLQSAGRLVNERNRGGILAEQGNLIVLLPHTNLKTSPSQMQVEFEKLAEAVGDLLKDMLGEFPSPIVFGGFHEAVTDLRVSHAEAKSALDVCRKMKSAKRVVWYDDVSLYVLLERVAVQPETMNWFNRTLGELVEYDRHNNSHLVQTLEAYFDANQQLQQTAYQLFIHPKTLKYRLGRIEKILGTNPFSKEQQLNYYLACKLAKLMDI
ncbi:MAG: PucR family transcriptional regulator ligand-binding domain-containing protein [Chloroflexi bacterium]|nr:PucR family transcriptional regulator ligand-binding domain-containing protein [Chloroflexota bacterium]